MAIGEPEKRRESLRVWLILIALVVAAFLGASLGLVWQSSGLGKSDEEKAAEEMAEAQAAEEAAEAEDAAEEEEEEEGPAPPTSA